jgi:TPR repeat protein
LEEGIAVTMDYRLAAFCYKMASVDGNAEGQFRFGRMLEKGREVERKINKAVRYFVMGAENGHKETQARLEALSMEDVDL